jgi:hypothetical protein
LDRPDLVRPVNARTILLGVVAVVAAIGVGSAITGIGPAGSALEDEEPRPPALLAFEAGSTACSGGFVANSSTIVENDGPNARVTVSRNISLPGPTEGVGGPTFERRNASTYELSIPSERIRQVPRNCSGVARYRATMRIPAVETPWRIVVQHDNETVTTVQGDADSTSVAGSASGGVGAGRW